MRFGDSAMRVRDWTPPQTWEEHDWRRLLRRVADAVRRFEQIRPPKSWSLHHETLYRVVKGWSLTITRIARACVRMLPTDVATLLALYRQVDERMEDLRLLHSFHGTERFQFAFRAVLSQAMVHYKRGLQYPEWRYAGWYAVKREIDAMRPLMWSEHFGAVDRATDDWRRAKHWSGIQKPEERARRARSLPFEPARYMNLSIQVHASADLFELERVTVGNAVTFVPARVPNADSLTVMGLQLLHYLAGSMNAARRIYAESASHRPASLSRFDPKKRRCYISVRSRNRLVFSQFGTREEYEDG